MYPTFDPAILLLKIILRNKKGTKINKSILKFPSLPAKATIFFLHNILFAYNMFLLPCPSSSCKIRTQP